MGVLVSGHDTPYRVSYHCWTSQELTKLSVIPTVRLGTVSIHLVVDFVSLKAWFSAHNAPQIINHVMMTKRLEVGLRLNPLVKLTALPNISWKYGCPQKKKGKGGRRKETLRKGGREWKVHHIFVNGSLSLVINNIFWGTRDHLRVK